MIAIAAVARARGSSSPKPNREQQQPGTKKQETSNMISWGTNTAVSSITPRATLSTNQPNGATRVWLGVSLLA